MSHAPLLPIRMAPFSGKISWTNADSFEETFENKRYYFSIQTPRWFCFIEKSWYKMWRIVMTEQKRLVGRVIAEFDDWESVMDAKNDIHRLFKTKFVKSVKDEEELEHGDIISVPTAMFPDARHFGVYDKTNQCIIEYQGERLTDKGRIRATPFDEFRKRVENEWNEFDLKVHAYLPDITLDRDEVVFRARSKIGAGKYGAIKTNCETFSVWCKTGNGQSIQSARNTELFVDNAMKGIMVVSGALIVSGLAFLAVITGVFGVTLSVVVAVGTIIFAIIKIILLIKVIILGIFTLGTMLCMFLHAQISRGCDFTWFPCMV